METDVLPTLLDLVALALLAAGAYLFLARNADRDDRTPVVLVQRKGVVHAMRRDHAQALGEPRQPARKPALRDGCRALRIALIVALAILAAGAARLAT
jgi:hypothetical protein